MASRGDTANDAVLAEGQRVLIGDPGRFDGVAVVGVDWGCLPLAGAHVWRHTRPGDMYVTVVIDLTPIRDGTGPARLLDMVQGRSKAAFKTWLADRPQAWRGGGGGDGRVRRVQDRRRRRAPSGGGGDGPVSVVRLAGEALDRCRRRVQQELHGHRGLVGDPLYRARRTLHTGQDLLTDRQRERLKVLFADADHIEVEAT